jgi:PEGA domain
MSRRVKVMAAALAVGIALASGGIAGAKEMVQPVSDNQWFDRATFQADYDRVWQVVFNLLSEYRFEFARKDKTAGKIETGYLVFSKNPRFSKLSNGVRSYGNPPMAFLKKWSDGRIKLVVQLNRLSDATTQVILRPDLQGFAATRGDDTGVTGEWRQCRSNGKFEFELLNEVATELRNPRSNVTSNPTPSAVSSSEVEPAAKASEKEGAGNSDVIFQSIPEGAEIYLNDKLIGMTPTRLSLSSGDYRVAFRKAGYKEYQREFVLFPRSDVTIATEMDKE